MTRPEELEACYRSVWSRIPIGLSITPFRVPGDMLGVPDSLRGSTRPLPLAENPELVDFLRRRIEERRVHVAMHGYEHTKPGGQPEYVGGTDLAAKTARGKRYLEELLGCRVRTFVPPNNGIGRAGVEAIAAERLNLVSNQPHPRGLGSLPPAFLMDALIAAQYALRNRLGRRDGFAIRSYLRFQQAPYHTLGPGSSLPALLAALRECRRCSGLFILATHYHAFERRMASGETVAAGLAAILDELASYDAVRFPTYAEIW